MPDYTVRADELLVIPAEKWQEGYSTPIDGYVEKKGGRDYLAWVYAERWLRTHHPSLHWVIDRDPEGRTWFEDKRGSFVSVYLADAETGKRTPSMMLAITKDVRGAMMEADYEFDTLGVHNTIQRAIVKLVARHLGLGLRLWEGDDTSTPTERPTGRNGMGELMRFMTEHLGGDNKRLFTAIQEIAPVIGVPLPQQRPDGGPNLPAYSEGDRIRIVDKLKESV